MEAAILDTLIVFELPEAPLGPLQVDPPSIPTEFQTRVSAPFSSNIAFSLRRELVFSLKTTSHMTD